jgi:hypothetical protein
METVKMRYNPTERIGVNAIEQIVLAELQWIFRDQPLIDTGIDAIIEVVKEGNPTCRFIATQIKSGKGNFHEKEKSYTYYASDIHYNYWTKSNLPVILIGYIHENSEAYWEVIEENNFIRTKKRWKIEIPKKQKFSAKSENRLLNLVGYTDITEIHAISTITIEYLLAKKEEIKYINESKLNIEELTSYLSAIKGESDIFTEKLKLFISQGIGINDQKSKIVFSSFANKISHVSKNMEIAINRFSQNFATGSLAFNEILTYCKDFNFFDVLQEAKQGLISYPDSADITIRQITDLKSTVDKFAKSNKELKQSTVFLSEVLDLIIREFSVAKDTVMSIIDFIEE